MLLRGSALCSRTLFGAAAFSWPLLFSPAPTMVLTIASLRATAAAKAYRVDQSFSADKWRLIDLWSGNFAVGPGERRRSLSLKRSSICAGVPIGPRLRHPKAGRFDLAFVSLTAFLFAVPRLPPFEQQLPCF